MLKAIVTILDENDRVIQANRLIFETDPFGTPVGCGIEHDFHFKIVTADEELIRKITEEGLELSAEEIRKMMEE